MADKKKRSIANNVDFKVIIDFGANSFNPKKLYKGKVIYHPQTKKTDDVNITADKITINGHRGKTDAFKSLDEWNNLSSFYKSTVYDVMLSSLIFYYLKNFETAMQINSITFILNDNEDEKITKQGTDIKFFDSKKQNLLSDTSVNVLNCDVVFKKSTIGKCFFNSSLYLLQAEHENTLFHAFERLWRSFNLIYNFHSGSTSDADGLKRIIQFIIKNNEQFKSSLDFLTSIDEEMLNTFRWEKLINNSVARKNFVDLVSGYKDSALLKIFNTKKSWIQKKRDGLKNKFEKEFNATSDNEKNLKKKQKIKNEIKALENLNLDFKITNKEIDDDEKIFEYLKLILQHYIYFVRCSYFHGSQNDSKYELFKNQKTNELDFINKFLAKLIVDCLNNINQLNPKAIKVEN